MPEETKKRDNGITKADSPVIKVNVASRGYSVHLGPYMPYNSGGFITFAAHSSHVFKTNTTIKTTAPKSK